MARCTLLEAGRLLLGVRFCRLSLRMNLPQLVPGTEGGLPQECLDMANAVQDPKARASLLQMAQVWLRLAQQHNAN